MKKRAKKVKVIASILLLTLPLTACGKDKDPGEVAEEGYIDEEFEAPEKEEKAKEKKEKKELTIDDQWEVADNWILQINSVKIMDKDTRAELAEEYKEVKKKRDKEIEEEKKKQEEEEFIKQYPTIEEQKKARKELEEKRKKDEENIEKLKEIKKALEAKDNLSEKEKETLEKINKTLPKTEEEVEDEERDTLYDESKEEELNKTVVINYTYKNIAYEDSTGDTKLQLKPDSVIDEEGNVAIESPVAGLESPEYIPQESKATNVEVAYQLDSEVSDVKINFEEYDKNGEIQKVTYNVPIEESKRAKRQELDETDAWEANNEWRLTINSIKETDEISEYDEEAGFSPTIAFIIDYSYKNLDYTPEDPTDPDLILKPFKVEDENGNEVEIYHLDRDQGVKPPQERAKGERMENARIAYGLKTNSERIKIYFNQPDSKGNPQKAIFNGQIKRNGKKREKPKEEPKEEPIKEEELDNPEDKIMKEIPPTGDASNDKDLGVATTNIDVNLRSEPTTVSKDNIYATVAKGTKLPVVQTNVGESKTWAIVIYDNQRLYVNMEYIR